MKMDRGLLAAQGGQHRRRLGRSLIDAGAIVVVALMIVKLLVAPRIFAAPQPAPEFAGPVLGGGAYRLSEHRGRLVLLDFGASWCAPCRLSLPPVERFARTHREVDVIMVDVGESAEVATAFAREHRLAPVVFDSDRALARAFSVTAFPTIVVIDPAGYRRATWTGFNPAIELALQHVRDRFAKAGVR